MALLEAELPFDYSPDVSFELIPAVDGDGPELGVHDAGRTSAGFRQIVLFEPVIDEAGKRIGTINATIRLDEADVAMARLRGQLLAIGIGALLVTCAAAAGIAWIGLRPIRRLSLHVRRISRGDYRAGVTSAVRAAEVRQLAYDIDHLRTTVQSLIGEEKRLREGMRQFVADVAHELRTPLTVLVGRLDLLLMVNQEPQMQSTLVAMRREVERLTGMTNDLVALVRVEAKIGMVAEPVDVADVCERAADQIRVVAGARNLTLRVDPGQRLTGDSSRIIQLLLNLLSNAVRHTAEDGHIELTASSRNGTCEITVGDDGPGVPDWEKELIFQRFFTGQKSESTGTGLGLAISTAIVKAHGGKLHVEDCPAGGALFVIRIPIDGAASNYPPRELNTYEANVEPRLSSHT